MLKNLLAGDVFWDKLILSSIDSFPYTLFIHWSLHGVWLRICIKFVHFLYPQILRCFYWRWGLFKLTRLWMLGKQKVLLSKCILREDNKKLKLYISEKYFLKCVVFSLFVTWALHSVSSSLLHRVSCHLYSGLAPALPVKKPTGRHPTWHLSSPNSTAWFDPITLLDYSCLLARGSRSLMW